MGAHPELGVCIVFEEDPAPNVIFEYPVAEVTSDIQEGYDWVAGLIRK